MTRAGREPTEDVKRAFRRAIEFAGLHVYGFVRFNGLSDALRAERVPEIPPGGVRSGESFDCSHDLIEGPAYGGLVVIEQRSRPPSFGVIYLVAGGSFLNPIGEAVLTEEIMDLQ